MIKAIFLSLALVTTAQANDCDTFYKVAVDLQAKPKIMQLSKEIVLIQFLQDLKLDKTELLIMYVFSRLKDGETPEEIRADCIRDFYSE